jgi:hypothetical protein
LAVGARCSIRYKEVAAMPGQNKTQKDTVGRVMHEFKHGELETSHGRKVRNPKQAIAIGLSEAGASNKQNPRRKKQNLDRTESGERRGETAQSRQERRAAQSRGSGSQTRAELYQEARERNIPGRSHMSKAELEKALHRH